MSLINRIKAYGTAGIVTVGAGAIWGQTLLQWVTQPSHLLPAAGIAAVTAGTVALSKGKGKQEEAPAPAAAVESVDERIARLAEAMEQRHVLPQGRPISYVNVVDEQASQHVARRV